MVDEISTTVAAAQASAPIWEIAIVAVSALFGTGGAAFAGTKVAMNGIEKRLTRLEDKFDIHAERLTRIETLVDQ